MKGKILSGRLFSAIAAIMLVAVITTPVLASPATATRTLPASVASGAEFDVAIDASGCGTFGQVVETLPSGFVYVSSSLPADQVEQVVGNMVKFTFLADAASFTYRVKAPTVDATTTFIFQGEVMDEDRIPYPIEDDDITVVADILAYYRAYSGEPNVVELSDLVKAANDWLSGEAPPGFENPITLPQLVDLANEWAIG